MSRLKTCVSVTNWGALTGIGWTQEHAASEFGINPRTLSSRLKQLDIRPSDGKHYSTKQIATAVYGDLERERIRLTSAEADAQEWDNREKDEELIHVEEFKKEYASLCVEMVRLIETSKLADGEKDGLRKAMAELHQ